MIVKGWQANTTGEDVALKGLEPFGAYDISVDNSRILPEYTWTSAIDCPEDIVNFLGIMLWYNDYSGADIERMQAWLRKELKPGETNAST